jgi:hypothetical protein
VRAVIGKPWHENAQGPDAYDCWGLARAAQKIVFGRDLPIVSCPSTLRALVETIENHAVRDNWPEVERATHGCLVSMTQSLHPHHIGTYLGLDGGRVLHATKNEGVMCCTLAQLRLEGFSKLRFHNYRAVPA